MPIPCSPSFLALWPTPRCSSRYLSAVARNQTNGNPPAAAFVTNNHSGTWVFPPNPNQGANS